RRPDQTAAGAVAVTPPVPAEGRRPLSAHDIAALTGGRLVGPGHVTVARVAPLERAGAGDLAFLASRSYLPYFERAQAAVVLCRPEFAEPPNGPPTRIVVADPHAALLDVLPILYPEPAWAPGVDATAIVGRGTTWADPVAIGPHVVLGAEVRLG